MMKIYEVIASYFGLIPASFWGVLAGSFFTILGINQTNKANDARLKLQFKHENETKSIEREIAIKKDIFLDVVKAMSLGVSAFSNFSDLDIQNSEVTKQYNDESSSIAKVYVIGKEETVKSIAKFCNTLSATYMEFFARRNQVYDTKYQLDNLKETAERYRKEIDKTLDVMSQFQHSSVDNDERWEYLQGIFRFSSDKLKIHTEEQTKIGHKLYLEQLELSKLAINYETKVLKDALPVILAIREELKMDMQGEFLEDLIIESQKLQIESMDTFINEYKKSIKKEEPNSAKARRASRK